MRAIELQGSPTAGRHSPSPTLLFFQRLPSDCSGVSTAYWTKVMTPYGVGLRQLADKFPRLTEPLIRAELNRTIRLKAWTNSDRQLAACDEVLAYLSVVDEYFRENQVLAKIAFLIHRAYGDFVTAMEGSLSGFHKVVSDAMRDVMEIEFLIRDFTTFPSHIDKWLNASERVRRNKYSPAPLRRRYASSKGERPQDMNEASDYKGHSKLLHVLPYENALVWATPAVPMDALGSLVCFCEIFEHARRLIFAVGDLCSQIGPPAPDIEAYLKATPTVWAESAKLWDSVVPHLENRKRDDYSRGSIEPSSS